MQTDPAVEGTLVDLDGRRFYRISSYDEMPPFFMTIVGASDVWLFMSSSGGVTAGRVDSDRALFPYYTDDKVTESAGRTGGISFLWATPEGGTPTMWQPFADQRPGNPAVQRALYKDVLGTTLVFEETRPDLSLRMRTSWQTSARFGIVRTCELANLGPTPCEVDLLDGMVNLLPARVGVDVQNRLSTLLDAYKRTELDRDTGLGLLTLSSTLTDLAEPSECLQANVVWQVGLDDVDHLLSTRQVAAFMHGQPIRREREARGVRGAYLCHTRLSLQSGGSRRWTTVGDVHYDAADVVALRESLREPEQLRGQLEQDVQRTRDDLEAVVASTDGLQATGDEIATVHHAANVLFNDMRGGVPADGYLLHAHDVRSFVQERSTATARRCAQLLADLPETLHVDDLLSIADASGDVDLWRLTREYLPLTFSRRHGDPSRPWNKFSIVLRDERGDRRLDYQGNWRDIFQNWEALAWSYPEYVEGMATVFLDATTADGYNPYRISRSGVDWEVPEPENPWSNIGYWSDHQIIYLLKLLETSQRFHPGRLAGMVDKAAFTHADVPYRIAGYEQTLRDPYDTITFDEQRDAMIAARVAEQGADGRLVQGADGGLVRVTLAEKLLLLALAKMVNFVPDGGIWMNTQRPEWNDANNALVGRGLSIVTLAYLRRYLAFVRDLVTEDVHVSTELAELADEVHRVLSAYADALETGFDARRRKSIMDDLGAAGTRYRDRVYAGLSAETTVLPGQHVVELIDLAERFVETSLTNSWREDGLVHSYNVLHLTDDEATIGRLAPMLEGQVAVLSSGLLTAQQARDMLGSLRGSALYRADQHSYMLYPDKNLPGFLAKNTFSADDAADCPLVAALVEADERSLVRRDVLGDLHFAAPIRNARDVVARLDRLASQPEWSGLVDQHRGCLLRIFEQVFSHAEFTGRSGTFFAYEGLGSIYWHMVSKLLLAVQENLEHAVVTGADPGAIDALAAAYEDVRAGLGYCKSPAVYGAFPADPYSHTPAGHGARQPGMTGQVKEEVLTRLGEVGVRVENGHIVLRPMLLRSNEWMPAGEFGYYDVTGRQRTIQRPNDSFAITFCQVPVVVQRSDGLRVVARLSDGTTVTAPDGVLDAELSASVFRRDGRVESLEMHVPRGNGDLS